MNTEIYLSEVSVSSTMVDRWLRPFPARSWPEAFHATFRDCEDRIGWSPIGILPGTELLDSPARI